MATSSFTQTLLKTLRDIREDFKGGQTTNVAYEDWDELSEDAEYDGKKVSLNKPFRTPGAERKFAVYVKNDKGNVVMVRFGDPNMEIKRDDPDRRSNYRARHGCDNPGPKWKANYWSCKMWAKKSVSDIIDEATLKMKKVNAGYYTYDYAGKTYVVEKFPQGWLWYEKNHEHQGEWERTQSNALAGLEEYLNGIPVLLAVPKDLHDPHSDKKGFWKIGDDVYRASVDGAKDVHGLPMDKRWESSFTHFERYWHGVHDRAYVKTKNWK